jgi:6-pyruvoyltetrahydropterin/6-carboxytetrahydropterin synthase
MTSSIQPPSSQASSHPTSYEVGIGGQFEAAHALRGDFGPATRRHGHTYRVEAAVRSAAPRADGTLLDITLLQNALGIVVQGLHYQDLDELPAFAGRNSTAEGVARYVFEALAPGLAGQGLATLSVRIWESPQAWAACDGPLG